MIRPLVFFLLYAAALAPAHAADHRTSDLRLSSPAIKAGGSIPRRFSCQGAGISPPLAWSGVPPEAESLALVVEDPDAPAGLWIHWLVYDLAPDSTGLAADAGANGLPGHAVAGVNSYHKRAYGGVCPPSGTHHYVFRLYALDVRLPAKAYDRDRLRHAMRGHVIDRTKFVAIYRKQ